ncbi:MAG: hypothetical protein CMP30_10950 [Roseibacillus sp.]|nr:hypothetical protein [Roseibacillus sp.]
MIIPVGIGQVVETTSVAAYPAAIDTNVEAVEGPEQALPTADWGGNLLNLELVAQSDAPEPCLALITTVQATFVVDRHGDP